MIFMTPQAAPCYTLAITEGTPKQTSTTVMVNRYSFSPSTSAPFSPGASTAQILLL